ncbi:MAG: DUF1697 domain-containing protein [Pseudomonadota bacterium]
MAHAVFFRNLNLGHPRSPTKAQFEQAFLDAGAVTAQSFLTNGTLVFTTKPRANAAKLLADAASRLHTVCGLVEPGFLRTVAYLRELVAQQAFAAVDPASVYQCCATFLDPRVAVFPPVPFASKRADVEVLRFTMGEALSISRTVGNTPGSPNAFLEKHFGLPATTRNWNTVVRLVQKYA